MAAWVAPAIGAAVTIGSAVIGGMISSSAQRRQARKEREERKRVGRVLAQGYRDQAADYRDLGERAISDIQRFGNEFLGEQTAGYGTMGGRIRGEGSFLSQEEVEIGEFDTEGYRAQKEAELTEKYTAEVQAARAALDRIRESNPYLSDEEMASETRSAKRRLEQAERQLKNAGTEAERAANKSEESWGINVLANMDLPDLTAAIDRRVREGGGSLMVVQNQALEQLETDILRVVQDTRKGMVKSYRDAREARKSGQTVGGDTSAQTAATILGVASDLANTYFRYKMNSPDMN